jgi:hypothetical protein
MNAGTFIGRYALWHYSIAFSDIARFSMNMTWFLWRVFSVPELTINLFTPFQRLNEDKPKVFSLENVLSAFVVNSLMRVVGAIARLPIILCGLVFSLLSALCGVVLFVVWPLVPFLIPALSVGGVLIFLGIL